uniref:DUF19 domain-containing protein n=1 Tax=Acrobeloides nanus TaxID=290746 RepID=A0A914EIZ7_9BILA
MQFQPLDIPYNFHPPRASNCSVFEQKEIHKCAEPLYEIGIFDSSMSDFSWEMFFSRTKDYFNQICDKVLMFDLCIETFKTSCFNEEPARGRYETSMRIIEFLCRGGYQEMSKSFECFSKTLTRAEMMQCQAEMLSDTNKISNKIPFNGQIQNAAVCGAMKNYVECIKYPVRYECGYRAWQDVRELIVGPASFIMPQCQLNSVSTYFKLSELMLNWFFLILIVIWSQDRT